MDFGRGFYTTTNYNQAKKWAKRQDSNGGVIIEFNIPKNEIASLNSKVFESADTEWESFVISSRKGIQNDFDIIAGPMLANPVNVLNGAESPKSIGQQIAFNTQKAIILLNKYIKRR